MQTKVFDKIRHAFMIKTLSKLAKEGSILSLIKDILKRTIPNIILNGEKLEIFLLRMGTRHDIPLNPAFHVVLTNAIRQEKETEVVCIGK